MVVHYKDRKGQWKVLGPQPTVDPVLAHNACARGKAGRL